MLRNHEPRISTCRLHRLPFHLCLWLALVWALAGPALRAELVLTNYSASCPLKVMAAGDSITDDSSINGAWRSYLQPLLQADGYTFTNLGRWSSIPIPPLTQTHHEGMDSAVIAYPGVAAATTHTYPGTSNYARLTLADALTNASPDLVLIDLGVNDMGRGRDPYFTATNDMAALLDMILAKVPTANIIVGKPTSISRANILTPPYRTYGTNMPIFGAALQALVNARRAQGQKVFVADLFSVVNGSTMLQSDGTHPNTTGLSAMANEWLFRIDAITVRPDRVVTPLIAGGSAWKYSDQGLDLGTNWAQPQYDDSAWAQGPARLGYNSPGVTTTVSFGPDSANKYLTTYFRRAFVVPATVHYTNLTLRLNRADGALVWLNGRELFRVNLPAGPVSFLSQATGPVLSDSVYTYFPTNVPIAGLPPGTNVVAVEVHKFSPALVSLSFDLELFGAGEYVPLLATACDGASFTLSWPTNFADFNLETCTSLPPAGAWQTVAGPYPLSNGCFGLSVPISPGPQQFFRLRRPQP